MTEHSDRLFVSDESVEDSRNSFTRSSEKWVGICVQELGLSIKF